MTFVDFLCIVAGYSAGSSLVLLAMKALRLRHPVTGSSAATPPSAADASERGDLGSIPKQNFWR